MRWLFTVLAMCGATAAIANAPDVRSGDQISDAQEFGILVGGIEQELEDDRSAVVHRWNHWLGFSHSADELQRTEQLLGLLSLVAVDIETERQDLRKNVLCRGTPESAQAAINRLKLAADMTDAVVEKHYKLTRLQLDDDIAERLGKLVREAKSGTATSPAFDYDAHYAKSSADPLADLAENCGR